MGRSPSYKKASSLRALYPRLGSRRVEVWPGAQRKRGARLIHVFIGTKAQYIKTAPILRRLDEQKITYNLIDSGQHARLSQSLRPELGLRDPDVTLGNGRDLLSGSQALSWMVRGFILGALKPRAVFQQVFRGEKGVCLIHGDTPTTLLSTFLAKRAGISVAHLEAGLRSYNYLNPFPEELIRMVVMRWADVLFAPGDWAFQNLTKMKLRGAILNLEANTNVDALSYALENSHRPSIDIDDFCLFTFHRAETLYSRRRLKKVVEFALKTSEKKRVLMVLHPPTELQLKRTGLYALLRGCRRIMLSGLLPHRDFVSVLGRADFVATDGGSIQEESFYLGVPCLLLRKKTERPEGLESNVFLSCFDDGKVDCFLSSYQELRSERRTPGFSPSERVVEHLVGCTERLPGSAAPAPSENGVLWRQ
jgi:UDP-N-acetylglucosamine 2-epimerase (non-hydrolysing)